MQGKVAFVETKEINKSMSTLYSRSLELKAMTVVGAATLTNGWFVVHVGGWPSQEFSVQGSISSEYARTGLE